eukprot:scaffold2536_cov169-Amphora_coffeaeformis.AAC.36
MEEQRLLQEGDLSRLMEEWRSHSGPKHEDLGGSRATKSSSPIHELRTLDVLFGRGKACSMRPGNILVRRVVYINQDYYSTVPKSEKLVATKALIAFFETKGQRFVEEDGPGRYRESDTSRVLCRIQQSLGEYTKRPARVSNEASMQKALVELKADSLGGEIAGSVKSPTTRKKSTSPANLHKWRAREQIRAKQRVLATIRVGDRLRVYGPLDEEYYPGVVVAVLGSRVRVHYDVGDREDVDLLRHDFILWKKSSARTTRFAGRPVKSYIAKRIEKLMGKCLVPQHKSDGGAQHRESVAAEGDLPKTEESDDIMSESEPLPDSVVDEVDSSSNNSGPLKIIWCHPIPMEKILHQGYKGCFSTALACFSDVLGSFSFCQVTLSSRPARDPDFE